ncbi:MAG: peptidyl-prolyl cis-trans isomerase [Spirochaetaceae bacterium]|nr:peptidyl-prolyl cis-trans isomerase [Spirochaetaceae bacterium]
MKKQVLIILAIFLVFGTLFAQNDLQPLATIKLNKTESVTLKQLKARCEVYKKQTGLTSFTLDQKKEILDALIDEKLILQAAAKQGISLTDSQTQELYLKSLANQVGAAITEQQFASIVKEQTGLSLDDFFQSQLAMTVVEYKTFLKNQYIAQQYVAMLKQSEIAQISATDAEVRDYYDMNQSTFFQSDILKLFLVIVPKTTPNASAKAQELLDSFNGKATDAKMEALKASAKAEGTYQAGDMYVSKNATAATQLGIDYTELLQLFKMSTGDFSELSETSTDYQFFISRGITPAKLLTLSDVIQPDSVVTVYEYIRENLTAQKQTMYFSQAVQEVTDSLRVPANFQMVRTGAALDSLLENW